MKIGYEAKRIFHNKTGLGNYSRDLVRMLSTFYPENQYLLYNPKKTKKTLFLTNEKNVFEKNPTTPFYKKFKNLWRQKGVVTDLKKDTIQLFHGLSGEIPSGLKKRNIKSVVTIHDLIFMRYPHLYSFIDRKIHYLKFKKAAKNADLIIAISEQTKQDIIHYLKIEDQKIKVVYQGCQPIFKTEIPTTVLLKVKEKFNLPDEFILNVGTIEERKNALSIVKAIKNSRTTLVLIGKQTDYTEQIHTYSKEHSLQQNIIFLKGITSDELAAIYQLATLFIYPSIFEGFGIPIIEALFSKTPVITTNSGVFPEAGGPHTIYVDPYDIREMEEKITFLLANPDIRKTIADKGFEFAQQFNDEVIAKNMMGIYESLV